MLNNLKKHPLLPAVRRWDSMFDSVMGKLDLFSGEEMHSELDDYLHPDISISDTAVTVRFVLPGVCKDQIDVEIENDFLTVRNEHSEGGHCKGKKVLRNERIHTEYCQSVRLPGNVKSSEAAASYKDGVLTVSIPRDTCGCKHTNKIEIK